MLVTLVGHDIFKVRYRSVRHRPTTRTLSSPAWPMTLGTSVASSKGTRMVAMSLIGLAARFHCRADPPTPRLLHITLSARSCLCWIVLRQSRKSTAHGALVRSRSHDSHPYRPLTRRKTSRELTN